MDIRRFGLFLAFVSLFALGYAGWGYYQSGHGTRWEHLDAIGAQIRGDIGPMLEYKRKQEGQRASARVALIIGGTGLVLGFGILISTPARKETAHDIEQREAAGS